MSAPVAEVSADAERFRHEAYLYRGQEEFLRGVGGFVREGLADGDVVVVVEPAERLAALRDALGEPTGVTFLDMREVGANPARILDVWAEALAAATSAGRRLRGVGEPAFPGRRRQEFEECHLHELVLGHHFGSGTGWRLLCPYDVKRLPGSVRDRALHSHREWSSPSGRGATEVDLDATLATAITAPLAGPDHAALRGTFAAADLPAVRRTVAVWARRCGLDADRVGVLQLAASELATNAIVHGSGTGTVAMWEDDGVVVLEVTGTGQLPHPLAGRLRPEAGQEDGAGLYLLNQLCDLVQLRSGPHGTTVRVLTWR